MDATRFVAYAREQIRMADVILAQHQEQIAVCSCGRPLPCSAAAAVARRRRHFVARLAQFDAPTVLGSARINGPLDGEIMPRLTEPSQKGRTRIMDRDPLMPPEVMFPMNPRHAPYSEEQPSNQERPFALRGVVQPTPIEAKHRTPYTNRPQKTTHTLDNRVVTDTYTTPDT